MTSTVSLDLAALAEAHSFEAAPASELDPDRFRTFGRAAIDRRRIEMTYLTAARGELSRRSCDPLHLRNHLGEWYLIAFDHMRGEGAGLYGKPHPRIVGDRRDLRVAD